MDVLFGGESFPQLAHHWWGIPIRDICHLTWRIFCEGSMNHLDLYLVGVSNSVQSSNKGCKTNSQLSFGRQLSCSLGLNCGNPVGMIGSGGSLICSVKKSHSRRMFIQKGATHVHGRPVATVEWPSSKYWLVSMGNPPKWISASWYPFKPTQMCLLLGTPLFGLKGNQKNTNHECEGARL